MDCVLAAIRAQTSAQVAESSLKMRAELKHTELRTTISDTKRLQKQVDTPISVVGRRLSLETRDPNASSAQGATMQVSRHGVVSAVRTTQPLCSAATCRTWRLR